MAVKKGRKIAHFTISRGKFSDQLVRKSVDTIVALYKDAGFAKVTVSPDVKDFEPQVDVTFRITEGPQDKVNTLLLEGNITQPRRILSGNGAMNLQPGSRTLLSCWSSTGTASLLRTWTWAISTQISKRQSSASLGIRPSSTWCTIDEGPQGHVSDVVVLGEKVTKKVSSGDDPAERESRKSR